VWGRHEVHEIHREWRRLLDSYGDRIGVGEISEDRARHLVRYYGQNDELHLSFYFHFLTRPWEASAFRRAIAEFEAELPEGSWPNYTLSNHDRPRAASRYGADRARVAMLMLLTLRGTPFIYYGEEIGMTDVPIPDARAVDIAGRDPERTPMQWDAGKNAGFTTGRPWLPISADAPRVNVEAQRDDPRSMLSFTRGVIALRRASAALQRGAYAPVGSPRDVLAFTRTSRRERLLVALSFSDRERLVKASDLAGRARLLISTDADRAVGPVDPARIALAANEGVIISLGGRAP
jgi:alpha-glucosidase